MMTEYYCLGTGNQRMGPYTLEQLLQQNINGNTYIWKSGLPQWTLARDVPEVAALLSTSTDTPPPPPSPSDNIYNPNNRPLCPPTNLIWGILVTLFCCLPLGIVAIYKSSQVERYYYNGQYEQAQQASQSAVNWCIASLVIGALIVFGYFGFAFLALPLAILGM